MRLRQFKIVLLIVFCAMVINIPIDAQETYYEKHIEVGLRMIGHQILLNSGDSTSRVKPVVKNEEGYKIAFDVEFEFVPEELVATINGIVQETQIAEGYILEVEECETGKVVYSYEMVKLVKSNIIPCKSRLQPKGCYNLLFTLKEESIDECDSSIISLDMDAATAERVTASEQERKEYGYLWYSLLMLGIVGVSFLVWKKRHQIVQDPNLVPIGKYYFDKHHTALRIEGKKIELTNKEADLLLFLYDTANETVEREVILHKVWGDEGDYIGRTLDVFISKLRKKLEADSSVKIINIRGVGYKLVADV